MTHYSYAWEKLLQAVYCLDSPGPLRERLEAGIAVVLTLKPEHFEPGRGTGAMVGARGTPHRAR